MVQRTSGGVFNDQMLTGSLSHYVVNGADFSGAVNSYGQPVPFSAAEIIFNRIESGAYVNIMNPNELNLSFALEEDRSVWNEASLTVMIQSLGTDVGVDHVDCSVCVCTRVPYIWDSGGGAESFLDLDDTPDSYAGAAGYIVTVNPGETGLIFTPAAATSNDYIPISAGSALSISQKYYITTGGIVTLPSLTIANTPGQSVTITKKVGITVFVNVGDISDQINTDIGTTDSIEFDSTQELIFIIDDSNNWELQIGSVL